MSGYLLSGKCLQQNLKFQKGQGFTSTYRFYQLFSDYNRIY